MGTSARVVVAVDFGTTFSGFAYSYVESNGCMQELQGVHKLYEWDGAMEANAVAYCKTQTSLYYVKDPDTGALELKDWGWPAYVSFIKDSMGRSRTNLKRLRSGLPVDNDIHQPGSAVGPAGHFITAFKLHLAGAKNEERSAGGLSAEPLPAGLSVERAITDYLTGLSRCIITQLQKKYGPQLTCKEVKWCLTVPAIWDDVAKQKMKAFAEMAGMVQGRYTPLGVQASPHELLICLEPEAASLYCLHISRDINLQKGDCYLIVDIGGGTVDIVAHEKANADNAAGVLSLTVNEVVASYGCLAGGTYVDKNFNEFMKKNIPCFESYTADKPKLRTQLLRTWELAKRTFTGKAGSSFALNLPAGLATAWENYDMEMGHELHETYDELELNNGDIKQIFDPVVDQIVQLISVNVVRSNIKVIMVVGGFSASPYVMDKINHAFSDDVKVIINPPEPGSAICHGAVLMGLSGDDAIVLSRVSRKTFGTNILRDFGKGHPGDKRVLIDGKEKCQDIFDVYAVRGARIPVNHKVTKIYGPPYAKQRALSISVYSTTRSTVPTFTTDRGVEREGGFVMDISDGLDMPDMGRTRTIEVTMFFGKSMIELQGRRTNFGDTDKIERFSVAL